MSNDGTEQCGGRDACFQECRSYWGGWLFELGLGWCLLQLWLMLPTASENALIRCTATYGQCLPALLMAVGAWLEGTDSVEAVRFRRNALSTLLLSPFLTWDIGGTGGAYLGICAALCLLSAIAMVNGALRLQMTKAWAAGRRGRCWLLQLGYWLFCITVCVPYYLNLFVAMSNRRYSTADIWLRCGELRETLQYMLLGGLAVVVLCCVPVRYGGTAKKSENGDREPTGGSDCGEGVETASAEVSAGGNGVEMDNMESKG